MKTPRKFILPNHIVGMTPLEWCEKWDAIAPYLCKYGNPDVYRIEGSVTIIEWDDAP